MSLHRPPAVTVIGCRRPVYLLVCSAHRIEHRFATKPSADQALALHTQQQHRKEA